MCPLPQFFNLTLPSLMAALLLSFSASAMAQWQWLDKEGRKVYSDRAPPGDVLEKDIIKRPGGQVKGAAKPQNTAPLGSPQNPIGSTGNTSTTAAAAVPAQGAASVPKLSAGVDKDLEAKKKQAADADAAKQKAAEEQNTKLRIENCARAKQAKINFESGVRIGRTNAQGEREVMDDATRAEELKRAQSAIDTNCR
jgi:Domain of unknown function (DUF4124)